MLTETCRETVSILYALIFGAGEACVAISLWSILSAFGAFIVLVVIAQFLARRLWTGISGKGRDTAPAQPHAPRLGQIRPGTVRNDDDYRDGPIRSDRR